MKVAFTKSLFQSSQIFGGDLRGGYGISEGCIFQTAERESLVMRMLSPQKNGICSRALGGDPKGSLFFPGGFYCDCDFPSVHDFVCFL